MVPTTASGRQALTASDARVIARYRSFTLVEGETSDSGQLRRAGATERDDMRKVLMGGAAVDPSTDREPLATKGSTDGLKRAGAGLVLVQLVGPVQDEWLGALKETGATVVTYMAENAYLVYASDGKQQLALARFGARNPAVRAVTRYKDSDKFTTAPPMAGSADVAVQTVRGAEGADARHATALAGEERRGLTRVAGFATQYVRLTAGEISNLSRDPAVVAILPDRRPKLLDERAAQIVAGNISGNAPDPPGYLAALTALGFGAGLFDFVVDITDEGVDKGVMPMPAGSHPDFYESGSTSNPSRIVYQQEDTAGDTNARDCGGHGTNVASIAAGYNADAGATVEDASGYNYGLGIAPRVLLGGTKIFNCAGIFDVQGTLTALQDNAYANGARVSNNSWGADTFGGYNADAQEYDAIVRDARSGEAGNQEITEVFAAGNMGYWGGSVGPPGTAKNVITVGASENVRPIGAADGCGVPDTGADDVRDIIDFSSRGPAIDGRRKPDIVAPGTHVSGAQPQTGVDYNGNGTCDSQFPSGSTLYTLVSGTSQATPEATGFAALLRDWYERTVGGGVTPPSPAMVKALMVNSASDQVGGANGAGGTNGNVPDNTQGWGRINVKSALDAVPRAYFDQSTTFGASGDSFSKTFAVQDASKPVKVSLVWTDAPGPLTGAAYVNNLDLKVSHGSGTFLGNVFDGGMSDTGGSADPRNNVENVFLPAGSDGGFNVTVDATNVAGDGVPGNADATDQDFALVVSNAAIATAPVLTHEGTTVTDLGDGDGSVEPGEIFNMTEEVRNAGNGGVTGVAATISTVTPNLSVLQAASAYPDMPAGATGSNSTAFSAGLDTAASCGSDLRFDVSFQTDSGSQAMSFKVPTGTFGAPVTRSTGATSIDIPDNDPVGVTSVLNVAGTGSIRDVNAGINISHTWDGDLEISLIGPDGTSVVLASRVGWDGHNFTNTVFDDEAATNIASGSAPFTGSFTPQADQLSRFDGKQRQGNWTLKVVDTAEIDTGTINRFDHTSSIAECSAPGSPDTTITAGPAEGNIIVDDTPAFEFTSEPGTTFECRVDAGAFAACTSPHTTAALTDDSHTFAVRAKNSEAVVDPTPATRTFTVDTTSVGPTLPVPPSVPPVPGVPPAEVDSDVNGFRAQVMVRRVKRFTGTATGAARVQIALLKRTPGTRPAVAKGKHIGACLWLKNSKGIFKKVRPTKKVCAKPVWLNAIGSGTWSFRLKKKLPRRSRYVLYSRAIGSDGRTETSFSSSDKNRVAFRIR